MIPKPAQYMLLSALGFSIMSLFVKLSAARGIPVMEILAARALISLVLSAVAVKAAGIPFFGNNKPLLIARGVIGFIALSMVYYTVTELPLAAATVLQFLNPMFTAFFGYFLLKEAVGRGLVVCIVLSTIGVCLMTLPQSFESLLISTDQLPPLAIATGIGGATLSAIAYVIVRRLSQTENPYVIIFYFPFVALPASIPFFYNDFVMPDGIGWLYLLLVGCFTQLGQVMLTKAMALSGAGKNTAYSYTQVVFAASLGFVFLGEIPSIATLLGAACILLGAWVNIAFKSRAA